MGYARPPGSFFWPSEPQEPFNVKSRFTRPEVAAALELLQSVPRAPRRVDQRHQISQLEDDANVLRAGIAAQEQFLQELRSAASHILGVRSEPRQRAIVLRRHRHLQAAAADDDDFEVSDWRFTQAGTNIPEMFCLNRFRARY